MVLFDLPVMTPEERKAATGFRNYLLDEGFQMAQFSVYLRCTPSKEAASAYVRRIESAVPSDGKVDILQFTDRQYEHHLFPGQAARFGSSKTSSATPFLARLRTVSEKKMAQKAPL
jgi:CRISPR-associated protein Cas2